MKVAIVSRQGLGDGLLMMICAHHFKKKGASVTFYHRLFHELSCFFPGYEFKELSNEDLSFYDLVLVEASEDAIVKNLIAKRNEKLYVIYPSFRPKRNMRPSEKDFICDKKKTMAENLLFFSEKLLNKTGLEKTNGITIPTHLKYQKFPKRIILHPTSTDRLKNWRKKRFLKLYYELKKSGYEPCFILAPHEKKDWEGSFSIFSAKNFHDLASFIYESKCLIGNDSGPAHLASNLNIPTIVLASNERIMKLWKPDFSYSILLTASRLLPNFSNFRFRNRYWSYFISVSKVLKNFSFLINKSLRP